MVSGRLGRLRKKAGHICDRANVCDGLTRHDFRYCQTLRWDAYHSDLDQLHIAKKKSQPCIGLSVEDDSHTSRVGTGSSELLSHLTDMFMAEKKNWEAATNNNPKLSLKKRFHHTKMDRRGVYLVGSSGDVSSWMYARSPLGGNSESREDGHGDAEE